MSGRTEIGIPHSDIPFLVAFVLVLIGAAMGVGYLIGTNGNADLAISARNAEVFQRTRADVYEERLAGKHNLTRPEIRACFMADVDSATNEAIAALDAELVR